MLQIFLHCFCLSRLRYEFGKNKLARTVKAQTMPSNRVFDNKIKFYILKQNALMIFQIWNGAWNKL